MARSEPLMSLNTLLAGAPARSVEDVVALMQAIDATLPDNDGVKWFNRLYLRVTEAVGQEIGAAQFNDAQFLSMLDVVFANQYFAALSAGLADVNAAPPAWRPLLQCRYSSGIARIQFALAGMNAHINRDLPDGLVQTFTALGGDPLNDPTREQDFELVNGLLERVETRVKDEFTVGVVGAVDRIGGKTDDAVAMWNVRAARAAAWTNGQVLWGLRAMPRLRDRFFDKLDRMVGMAGQAMLVPRDQTGISTSAAWNLVGRNRGPAEPTA